MNDNPQAEIDIQQQIPIILSFVSQKTGRLAPIPPLTWNQSPVIGEIVPTANPAIYNFIPKQIGTTQISCSWE